MDDKPAISSHKPHDSGSTIFINRCPKSTRRAAAACCATLAVLLSFISPLTPFVMIVLMGLALLWRDDLTLDVENRTYEIVQLFFPRRGTFADLKGLEIDRQQHYDSNGHPKGSIYSISLVWIDAREKHWVLSEWNNWTEALTHAQHAAQEWALPLNEGEGLVQFRRKSEGARKNLS